MDTKVNDKKIATVIQYILTNLNEELTLETLSSIANYSPFHFQKLFKHAVGESPKQYIIRLRLENAAHSLFIHRYRSITEIALDSGFASGATFARAFRNYFGISADAYRKLSHKEKIDLRQFDQSKKIQTTLDMQFLRSSYDVHFWETNLQVRIKRVATVPLIFTNAPLSDTSKISDQYRKIAQLGEAHDLVEFGTQYIGLINPHQGLYQAGITVVPNRKVPKGISTGQLDEGKFATYTITGNSLQTLHSLHAFYELWLPQSGYKIARSNGFEILSTPPFRIPYEAIAREIHIAIEPADA